jgi:hypothetical protein
MELTKKVDSMKENFFDLIINNTILLMCTMLSKSSLCKIRDLRLGSTIIILVVPTIDSSLLEKVRVTSSVLFFVHVLLVLNRFVQVRTHGSLLKSTERTECF